MADNRKIIDFNSHKNKKKNKNKNDTEPSSARALFLKYLSQSAKDDEDNEEFELEADYYEDDDEDEMDYDVVDFDDDDDEEDYEDEEDYDEYDDDYYDDDDDEDDYYEYDDVGNHLFDLNSFFGMLNPLGPNVEENDELLEEKLKQLMRDMGIPENPGLHDLFNVPDEVEESWYMLDENAYQDVNDLKEAFSEFDVDTDIFPLITVGYVREACRKYHEEMKEFFLEEMDVQLANDTVDEGDINLFVSAFYFFAEYHVEEAFDFILTWLLRCGDNLTSFLQEMTFQHAHSLLYAIFHGGPDQLFDLIDTFDVGDNMKKLLGFVLAQYCIDVLPPAKQEPLLRKYIRLIHQYDLDGSTAAEWIVAIGFEKKMKKELGQLLHEYVDFFIYGTTNPDTFVRMMREDERDTVFCEKGLVMDDAILYGMYPSAIKADPAIRQRALDGQMERIAWFKKEYKPL